LISQRYDNILLLGAGHIGAMSDLNSDNVNTYAKFFSKCLNSNICIVEPDEAKASVVSSRYGYRILSHYNPKILSEFSMVIIASPSNRHHKQLIDCINAGVPIVICEKPICTSMAQLEMLQSTFNEPHNTNIFVNYPRTFMPEFLQLKEFLQLRDTKNLVKIQVRYQRGFLNNCSHAFDLISFILDRKIQMRDFTKTQSTADHFKNDPTISGFGYWGDTLFELSGIPFAKYSLFEIDMFFEKFRIIIDECGRRAQIYEADKDMSYVQAVPACVFSKSVVEYSDVVPVLKQAFDSRQNQSGYGHFERSLSNMCSLLNLFES
jgi:hypothetical protein